MNARARRPSSPTHVSLPSWGITTPPQFIVEGQNLVGERCVGVVQPTAFGPHPPSPRPSCLPAWPRRRGSIGVMGGTMTERLGKPPNPSANHGVFVISARIRRSVRVPRALACRLAGGLTAGRHRFFLWADELASAECLHITPDTRRRLAVAAPSSSPLPSVLASLFPVGVVTAGYRRTA